MHLDILRISDIWTALQPHMFPNQRATTYANYIDGNAAKYQGYTALIQNVVSGTYPRNRSCYFYIGSRIIEVTGYGDHISTMRHVLRVTDHGNDISVKKLKVDSGFFTYFTENSGKKERKIPDISNPTKYLKYVITEKRLSLVHEVYEKGLREKTVWDAVSSMLNHIKLGKLWLPFLRYFHHNKLGKYPPWYVWERIMRKFSNGKSVEEQKNIFRVMQWSVRLYKKNKAGHMLSLLDKALDDSIIDSEEIETNRYNAVVHFRRFVSNNDLDYAMVQEYTVLRYREGNHHLWEYIRQGIFMGKHMTEKMFNGKKKLEPNRKFCETIMACIIIGDEHVLDRMRDDVRIVLAENFPNKVEADKWMYELLTGEMWVIDIMATKPFVLNWLTKKEPRWIYGTN